jgi:hypothetical protein
VTRAGFTVITLKQSNTLPTGKGEVDEGQSQEHAHHFL